MISALTLVIGNKTYSSWSLRPRLLLRHLGVAFQGDFRPAACAGHRRADCPLFPFRPGSGPTGRRSGDLGVAGDRRISGRTVSGGLAGRCA